MTTKLTTLIDRHKRFYEQNEKTLFDKARQYYQGNFFRRQGANSDKETNMFLCSKNLIYAIADTAVSALLGPNPQVSAQPRNPISQEAAPAINGLMEYTFQTNKMRRRAATALIDAVLCKRGIFKTGWSVEEDRPIVKVIDPSSLFFDLTVRDVDDIRYWIEATVVPYTVFKERVASGRYKSDKIDDVQPDRYPSWILGAAKKSETDMVRDAFEWVTIYEYYDRDRGIVQHYIKQADTVIFEEKIDYIPYSMFSLNQSGVDCLGLSEVQLVLNQQETINDLLTHMKQITYLMVPRILYDSGRISEEDLNKAVEASAGAFVGISPENSEALRTLATLFYEMPMPQNPVGVEAFVARQEGDAAFISALAEAARGQVTGARTATEMAIIDAQMRTRLATREGHLNTAIEDVAAKCFYLCRKYMKHEKMVRISGSERWFPINHETIHEVMVNFEMVSYNPIRQNPSVLAETLIQLLPFLQQNPHVDVRRLTEEVVAGLSLPNKILMNQADVAAKAEAEAALQQQLALGGAAAPGGPPGGGGGMPPELAALMGEVPPEGPQAADSLAAGGGTPLE
tara:strand:- start:113 stop:1822 length:1710 start_codon:yes stop_codon:yes gene_type:complete